MICSHIIRPKGRSIVIRVYDDGTNILTSAPENPWATVWRPGVSPFVVEGATQGDAVRRAEVAA